MAERAEERSVEPFVAEWLNKIRINTKRVVLKFPGLEFDSTASY